MAIQNDTFGPRVMAFTQFVKVAEGTRVTDYVAVLPPEWTPDVPVSQQYIDDHCCIEDVWSVLYMR